MDSELPRDFVAHLNLGSNFATLGQYDKALAETQEAQRLDPNNIIVVGNLGLCLLALHRLDEAKATFDQVLEKKVDGGNLRLITYYFAFLRGSSAQMEQQLALGRRKAGS